MGAAWRLGYWIGSLRLPDDTETAEAALDNASLTLLALLLAFTFGGAMTRHEQRRAMVVADSNAIGDLYTCASLLDEPVRGRLQQELREYTKFRLDITQRPIDAESLEKALLHIQQSHNAMTVLVREVIGRGTSIAVPLTYSLNEVTSSNNSRLAAYEDRLPPSIMWLLMISSVITSLLVGRAQGKQQGLLPLGTASFIVIVALCVYATLDLNQPERGLVTVSQRPIERMLESVD